MGGGALIEFASAVAAARCAQQIHQATNAEPSAPEAGRIRYRIGLNLGEVIVEGDDICGDGVKVAARLQAIAEPGGIALSATVRDQTAGKLPAEFEDLGEHAIKSIARPVHVFALRAAATQPSAAAPAQSRQRLAICVLPFANISGDPEQEYFGDGITEDITTDLSRAPALAVVSRNTAFTYKAKSVDVAQVARQLKVNHVLEGSVRKSGTRDACLNAASRSRRRTAGVMVGFVVARMPLLCHYLCHENDHRRRRAHRGSEGAAPGARLAAGAGPRSPCG